MSEETTLDQGEEAPAESTREIMRRVRSTYVGLARDERLEQEVQELIEGADEAELARLADPQKTVGRLGEGRALVVLGASGAGKTRALDRLLKRERGFLAAGDETPPAISVTAPSPCTLRLLGLEGAALCAFPRLLFMMMPRMFGGLWLAWVNAGRA